eukprot:NODE_3360_length_796_cov_283.151147.p4 GENE.NODE_3360_length_796_cov_283.151147~~NODE_3360_length_796_cov_283.151147.p4  ORF type:complete len:95 (-),score=9.26 NODE_3360_length_796_cov_283.151147:325-609(-)
MPVPVVRQVGCHDQCSTGAVAGACGPDVAATINTPLAQLWDHDCSHLSTGGASVAGTTIAPQVGCGHPPPLHCRHRWCANAAAATITLAWLRPF